MDTLREMHIQVIGHLSTFLIPIGYNAIFGNTKIETRRLPFATMGYNQKHEQNQVQTKTQHSIENINYTDYDNKD